MNLNHVFPTSITKIILPRSGKNFLTNPTKKGSGYGYNSLTIGHDLQYSGEAISRPDEIRAGERKVSYLRSEPMNFLNVCLTDSDTVMYSNVP